MLSSLINKVNMHKYFFSVIQSYDSEREPFKIVVVTFSLFITVEIDGQVLSARFCTVHCQISLVIQSSQMYLCSAFLCFSEFHCCFTENHDVNHDVCKHKKSCPG